MLKNIFQLIRFPGIFTAFSNVLIGFFLITNGNFEFNVLPFLLTTTGLLFAGTMVMNDYSDHKIDSVERPKRPLPSGKISRNTAIYLTIICFSIGNLSAVMIGETSIIISLLMTGLIISYNFKLKNITSIGIFTISAIRFLNIILGFSIVELSLEILPYAIPVAIYVVGISILAKNELDANSKDRILNKIFLILTISSIIYLIVQNYSWISIIFLGIFSILIFFSLKYYKTNISKIITIQILGIILLDAIIVSLSNELIYGVIIASLTIPAYIITKKLYIT
ncbi:UbiA family prenyltransferase [Candidatus Nitrosopelagicus sp.]|nr:UbiA family prenyltransferase [Candidatus Nitrosopelagicus sp.]